MRGAPAEALRRANNVKLAQTQVGGEFVEREFGIFNVPIQDGSDVFE